MSADTVPRVFIDCIYCSKKEERCGLCNANGKLDGWLELGILLSDLDDADAMEHFSDLGWLVQNLGLAHFGHPRYSGIMDVVHQLRAAEPPKVITA